MIRLASLLSRLEKHREKAKELAEKNVSEYLVFNALAMECFQAVNSAIELGELIVSEQNLGFPATYREIFELLHNAGIVTKETLNKLSKLIFFRNLIAHEYYKITEEELKEMAHLLECLDELREGAKRLSSKRGEND